MGSSLLVFPSKPGIGQVSPTSDFRATVGKVEYEVRSVTAASGSSDLKTVIVFDLASIPPDYQPCFIQQARAMAPELRRIPNVCCSLFHTNGQSSTSRLGTVQMTYEYFLPESKAATKDECASQSTRGAKFAWSEDGGENRSRESFRGLAEILQGECGPIRVLWIGQDFTWVYAGEPGPRERYVDIMEGRSYGEPDYTPNAAYLWLDAFTRAGISFWPVVWLNGESEQAQHPKLSRKCALEIVKYLGGQTALAISASRPLSRRSGCVSAEPYPPLRSAQLCGK